MHLSASLTAQPCMRWLPNLALGSASKLDGCLTTSHFRVMFPLHQGSFRTGRVAAGFTVGVQILTGLEVDQLSHFLGASTPMHCVLVLLFLLWLLSRD